MPKERTLTKCEEVGLEDLQSDFLSLRVGEEIPRLEIASIRKLTNKTKQDNLSGVDYKYIIESKDKKVLRVNSWLLWKKIAAVLKEAGQIRVVLELKHPAIEDYRVRVL